MKKFTTLTAVTLLTLVSFGSFARSVTVTAPTLDGAEAKVAALAEQAGTQYTITGARVDNRAYVSAELN